MASGKTDRPFDPVLTPREGMPSPRLAEQEFRRRYLQQFEDPAFEPLKAQLDQVASAAWEAYRHQRKSPYTSKAGPEFHDPAYDLSVDWIAARDAIRAAQARHDDASLRPRILLINGSPRSEHTCPGEMSKSYRMMEIAETALAENGDIDVDVLDLSRLASEYGRHIHPCKSCFSTSPALCHWPCSCYPNHSLGQVHDWMNDIYPLWVAAHGVMIIIPVHWYQVSSPVKLMMDRLVCADGGNPDPTLTQGKDAALAKQIEMQGWQAGCSPSSSMAMRRAPRTQGEASPTGCGRWNSFRRAHRRNSTATSVIGNLTAQDIPSSIQMTPSARRCEMRPWC